MNYKAITGIGINNQLAVLVIRTGLLLFLFFLFTSQILAQGKAITVDGKDAILHPNGKWTFVKKSRQDAPKLSDCKYSKCSVDSIKGSIIRVLNRERLVSFTPLELKKIFELGDYLTMDAYLSNYNNYIALFLKITILSNNSQSAYGSIYKDARLVIKMKDGQSVTLYSGQSESGNTDFKHDKTSYMTFFHLNESALRLLQTAEMKTVRLYWSKRFEEYSVNTPDFFQRQIRCVR